MSVEDDKENITYEKLETKVEQLKQENEGLKKKLDQWFNEADEVTRKCQKLQAENNQLKNELDLYKSHESHSRLWLCRENQRLLNELTELQTELKELK